MDSARYAQGHRHMSFGLFPSLPYNTALALQAYGTEAEVAVPWTVVKQPAIRYDFDLFGEVLPRGESLIFKVTYRSEALSETSAAVMVRQFAALAELLLAANPNDSAQGLLSHIPHDLLSAEGTIPLPVTDIEKENRVDILHAQFESQASATPNKLALSFYDSLDSPPTNLTYAELDARANGLANVLRLEDADVIPICMHRSIELYVSILAIIKAGSAWSPIDETSPVQRRTSLIARTQGKVLLTTSNSFSLVEPCLAHESLSGVRVIFVDQYAGHVTNERPLPRPSIGSTLGAITGQDLAYLLWTSGTTGEPKGVMMPHAAAAHAMRDLQVRVEHDPSAGQVRTLQLSAYSFDVFVQDLFYTWGLAGSVISGTRELVLGTFTEFVKTARPTHAHLTPSFGASIDVRELAGSTLRFVTFIGEKLTEDVAEAWAAPDITTKAYNTYGPAENAVVSTMRQFFGKSCDRAKAANVGFPLTPCTAYVVREVYVSADDKGDEAAKRWELVPRYGVGELALGGAQVGKGYLNNEAKTTKSFIFSESIGERIYLTGDMVRLNDHGFEFLGRNDDLVKITGIRIELSEISAACALVKETEAALEHVETLYLPRPGGDGSHKVIVSFVSVKESDIDTAKIRQQVFQKAKEVLPAYMVPGHVAVLNTTMPRTASNKVDRKALQAIYATADLNELAGASTSTDTKVEWSKAQLPVVQAIVDNLAVPLDPLHPLHPDDSLAGHGFSSLQITKLAWALRRQHDCSLRVLDLMRCQTVGELVDVVVKAVGSADNAENKDGTTADAGANGVVAPVSWVSVLKDELTQCLHGPLRPDNTAYILPATPVQESLLVESLVQPGAYWSHRLFDLAGFGAVDAERLQSAWAMAAVRLDILRTVFVPLSQLSHKDTTNVNTAKWAHARGVHATVLQLVLDNTSISWTELDNDAATANDFASRARKIQSALAPLGGENALPPWAVTYAPASRTLMLSMHHSLYDGESSRMLLDVVSELYRNPVAAGRPDLPPLPLLPMSRGLDLGLLPSVAQRDEATAAWSKRLHGLVETDGSLNAPFPDLTGSRQPQSHAILSSKATIPDEFLALAHNIDRPELPRLVLSAFGCVLAALLELKTIVLGQTVSQRILHSDLSRVVGPAVATLPVAIRTHSASARDLWSSMSRDASSLGTLAHHLHPVDVKKMANEVSGDPNAPFPALFVYHPAEDEKDTDNTRSLFHEVGQALALHVEHPMALNVFEDGRVIELTGDARRISQPMLDVLLAQVLDQARTMLSHPNVPLRQIVNYMDRSLVSIVGEHKALVGTSIAMNPAELVAKQVAEHPDWVAIEEIALDDDDNISTTTVTYGQLQTLVDAIVSRLMTLAVVNPGDVVAVYLERNAASLAAILAIFKLNCVYLPIDGDLPTVRKQLLVQDANAVLVLTTESLVGDLDITVGQTNSPYIFLLPDGDDDLDTIMSWPTVSSPPDIDYPVSNAGGYLLYTSGSTGRPKGVRVTNESLLHYVAAMTQRLAEANPDVARLGGVGKFLNVASRAFDTHLTTMFAPWHLGFCSVIGKDRNGIFANLQHVINTVGITNMGTVPSVLLQLGLRLSDVPSIRVMTFGGEKASHELFDQLGGTEHDGDGKAALMNFYGPTEAAVGCMSHVVGHHSNARNLGLPLPGLEAILLVPDSDGDEQIVARRGQPGEFCIAGPQVAVGYLDRPEENARSFQHTTLLGTDGTQKRIYRTGDIMRMMHDGTVEFLGRRDQQTKIRGQRFEIGEVEAYIKKVIADQGPLDVAAAVVDQRLIGLLARKHTSLFKAEREAPAQLLLPPPTKAYEDVLAAVEQACQQGLPSFMVPEMMWLSKMPFLPVSGKLDTKLIIQLVRDAGNADNGAAIGQCQTGLSVSTSPLSESEKEVTDALAEVLGSPVPASSSSNIRILGIDSLSGVHLLSVLKRRGFSNVTLPDLLSPSANIHAISNKFNGANLSDSGRATNVSISPVTKLGLADLGPSASHIDPSHIAAILPCLPLQSSLVALSLNWLHNQDDNQSPAPPSSSVPYVTEFNFQLEPTTNVELWRQATEQVVSSEAVLSTFFVQREQDGQIFQVVLSSPPSPFLPFDGSHDYNAASLVSHISSRPPIRLQVRNGGRVSLLIHHALYDGAAIATLRAKIEHSYRMLVSGQPVPSSFTSSLASLRHLAQHCNLTSQQLQSVKTAWQCKLVDTAPCLVARQSSGTPKPASDITIRTTRRLALTATQLKEKLQNVSTSTALQVATALVVSSLTAGSLSVVYGFTTSLRQFIPPSAENIDMDQFIGPCLNTVVHALSLQDGNETLPQLSTRVAQYHAEVGYGHMPFITADQIQRWAGLDGKIFDSLLTVNFVDTPGDDGPAPIMRSLPGKAKLDLALTIDVNLHADGRIELMLASTGVLDEAQLATAGQLFETVLENASNSLATVSQFVHVDRTAIGHAVAKGVVSTSSSSATSRSNSTSISSTGSTTDLGSVRSLACQLLRLNEAGVPADVSLYRLGLDSINVLPFVKLISKVEGIKVTPNAVLRARTLQGVASLVHAAKLKNTQQTSLVRDDAKLVLPNSFVAPDYDLTLQQVAGDLLFVATPLQEGMLSASLALADQAYTYTHTMQLSPAAFQLDAPRFEHFFAAVQKTVLSCEILRTRFIFTDHSQAPWVGVVSPSEQSNLLSWNVSVSGVIQLRIHHALYDASSIQNLWRLLRENYTGQLSGASIGQAQKQTHLYRPFAKQVAIAQKDAVEFWVNTLQDYNFAPISLADDGADLQPQHASSSFHFSMHATQFDSLLSTCRNASVTLKAALQLAWAKVLCEILYKQADIVFGEVITTNSDDAASSLVMGPTINTIPMRLKLTLPSSPRSQISISDALIELQSLGDNARGPIGMASLRDVQTAWRSSRADGTDTSAGLFQSLFVFDGDVSSASASSKEIQGPIIPVDATDRPISSLAEKAPLYDDYPLITSFRIRDGVLHGALRAKVSESTVHRLGSQLTAALHYIASSPLQTAALDPAVSSLLLSAQVSAKTSPSVSTDVHINGSKNLAEPVLELAKQVIGARIRGNVDYGTKLVNIGLDSISAIRYSNILKKTMGIHVSVFDIIKGATVASIVQKHSAADKSAKATVQSTPNTQRLVQDEDHFKSLVAAKLGLPSRKQIKSVAPILSGQRHTLLHWLKSGKRFFEAPWVYRVSDSTFVDEKTVAGAWKALCTAHDVLRTTFVSLDDENVSDLVQMTLHPSDAANSSITVVRDTTTTISGLVQTHVRETNDIPSNLISPPSRLSFIEGFDGQAIVFRLHHALYDAWSIKMILSDLNNLFGGGTCSSPPPSLQSVLQDMATFRDRDAEQAYWKQHLAGAKDSVLRPVLLSTGSSPTAPLGPHFKSSHPDVTALPVDAQNKTQLSATIIAAYAHSLGQLTNCSQPTFGLNYSGRSLSSTNSSETLELTDMSVPTMAVVPMSVTVGKGAQQQSINDVQTHLAALTKFAQADGLHKLAPSYNTHINILFADADKAVGSRNTNGALQRYRLGEPLASEYFTTAVPSPTATSTIDGIDVSLLPREQLYFNVLVRDGSVSVDVSGDMDLVAGDSDLVSKLVCSFASTLANMMSD